MEYSCFRETPCILLTQVQSSRIKFTLLSVSRSSSKLSFAFAFEIESKYAFSPLQKLSETAKTISSSDPRFVLPKDCKFPKKISRFVRSKEKIFPPPQPRNSLEIQIFARRSFVLRSPSQVDRKFRKYR